MDSQNHSPNQTEAQVTPDQLKLHAPREQGASRIRLGLGASAVAALVLGLAVVAFSTLRDAADPFSWLRGASSRSLNLPTAGAPGLTPSFRLPVSSGALRSSEEFTGRPVILHFWASWCAPCLEEIPKILGAVRALKDLPIQWVFISLDHRWADAEKILPSATLTADLGKALSLLDVEQKVSEAYGSFQFPETYVFDSAGKRLSKWVGPQAWDNPELHRALRVRFGTPLPAKSP